MSLPTITVLLPYVGRFPNYFRLFLASCKDNPTLTWQILSSEPPEAALPPNVVWRQFTMAEMAQRVRERLQIDADIRFPYKLCDFRPAYGTLFAEYCSGFDFWGHCDADMLFGDVRKFLSSDILNQYVKVQSRGAFSLYRNDAIGNALFRLPCRTVDYCNVFKDYRHWGFDEWQGIFRIMRENGVPFYQGNVIAEIRPNAFDLRLADRPHHNHVPQMFMWREGRVLRRWWDIDGEHEDEYLYMHLQKRRFKALDVADPIPAAGFYILPDSFVEATGMNGGPEWARSANGPRKSFELAYQLLRLPEYVRRMGKIKRFGKAKIRAASGGKRQK